MTTTSAIQPVVRVFPVRVSDRTSYIFEVRLATMAGAEVLIHEGPRLFGKPTTAERQGQRWLNSSVGQRLVEREVEDLRREGVR